MKYVIFVENDAVKDEVIETLFPVGYRWFTGEPRELFRPGRFLYVDGDNKTIIPNNTFEHAASRIMDGYVALDSGSVRDCFLPQTVDIEGQTFAVETVKAALEECGELCKE